MKEADSTTYMPTIGIECHVQLNTKTKLFSAVKNDSRGAEPNSLISHIDAGLPGALPVLNEEAVKRAITAAYALNTKPAKFSKFDRKHYFYPDLPKGYQITQYEQPIIQGGYVEVDLDGSLKRVQITRVNLEEDAGKISHPETADYSLVDLNRAGTPLLEVVSEPMINSAKEAKAYTRELWLLMKYAQVTDGDLYLGHVRFDVNISLSPTSSTMGTRTEIKNLNSFRSVEAAINYEIERQTEVLGKGEKVTQETRGWDEAKQKTTEQRKKEESHDYRYFPEPDIPPLELNDRYLEKINQKLPVLPGQIRRYLIKVGINRQTVEDILDKTEIALRVLQAIDITEPENARRIAYDLLENQDALRISIADHIKVAESIDMGLINSTSGGVVISQLANGSSSVDELIKQFSQISDSTEIEAIIQEVLRNNPKAVEDIKRGEQKAIGFLVGQVMLKTGGKANPNEIQKILKTKLST